MDKIESSFIQTTFLPFIELFQGKPYIQAAVVAAVAFVLAFVFTWILKSVLLAVAKRTHINLDNQIVQIIRLPLFYTLLMIGLSVSTGLLPVAATLKTSLYAALKTFNIIVWSSFLVKLSKILLKSAAENEHRLKFIGFQTLPLFQNLTVTATIAISIYLIFQAWGIELTAWLASAGVLGIAIGFASKDTLSNFISGIFILADTPYKLGDYVVLDTGERGAVTHIGIRSTRMLTRDDVELTIPNAIMGNTKIVNESGGPHEKFRIRIPVGVAYGSDIEQIKQLLMDAANSNPEICKIPEARVRFRALGASSLDFHLMCWVEKPALRGKITDELLTHIYNNFNQHNIEIPYTKQDLYIRELPKSLTNNAAQ